MYSDQMKRKVAKVGALRLSPNEEAVILKQERERRRKLRLQQVREQEKFIAQQIRQDVKERRDQQLQQLAEELRAKWEADQAEKLQALEKIYLSTLNAIGDGHRQAKENEPDLKAIEKTMAVNKEKAEKRHREALKELKQKRERELRQQTWHIKSRKNALNIEKERAEKIASLPPPPPDPLENLELGKRLPLVKVCNIDSFSASHYHLPEAYVDRERDMEQPDARTAAIDEAKRLEALQKEEEQERLEQMEKANLRGSHALKMVQLTQDRDRLMKDLELMQKDDLTRRRQIVAKMPQQLFEPAYRRAEIREEWQRELESAFEDMYTKETKMKGDMVLHLKPQPLPESSVTSADEVLDLSVDPEALSDMKYHPGEAENISPLVEPQVEVTKEPQSKLVLKKLLNRIRTQKDQWTGKSDVETVSDTVESGSLPTDSRTPDVLQKVEDDSNGDLKYINESSVLAGNSILPHPQEPAMHVRMEQERQKKMEDLERQKQEQVELIYRLEEERKTLEAEYYKMQLQMQEASRAEEEQEVSDATEDQKPEPPVQSETEPASVTQVSELNASTENLHIQLIRDYQQRLLQQNRQHKQSVDEARKRLQEYQALLKKRYPHLSTSRQEITSGVQESMDSLPSPKLRTLESNNGATMLGDNGTVPQQMTDLYSSQLVSKQRSDSRGLTWPGQIDPRIVGSLQEELETGNSSSSDLSAQLVVDPHKFTNNSKSPVIIPSPNGSVSGERRLQVLFSDTDAPYQSPDQIRGRPENALIISEKHSSTSSPGDHDTSSGTSYHPLPSDLSLGLPSFDFSPTNIPLTVSQPRLSKVGFPAEDFANAHEFQERLLSSTAQIHAQQDQLKELQVQLDKKRESLLSQQKIQEERLLQKQRELEEQMRQHQESLGDLLGSREPKERTLPTDLSQLPKNERYSLMSTLLKALDDSPKDVRMASGKDSSLLMRPPGREQRWRPSKPPVTKTKLGSLLEQHELSAIMELETPTSGRHSRAGLAEPKETLPDVNDRSAREEPVSITTDLSRRSSDSTPQGLDLSRLSSSSKDQSSNDSANQSGSRLSWREMLSLEAARDQSGSDQPYSLAQNRNVSLKHHTDEEIVTWLGKAAPGSSPETLYDHLSTTTISTGSFLTSEKTDSSPGNSDTLSDLQRCNYSIIAGGLESPSAAASTMSQPDMRWHHYLNPAGNPSLIQQIIDKYTKDLSASLERNLSFHSPEAAIDTSAADNNFPITFHQLEPKPDFSISTPSYALSNVASSSQYTGELSQLSSNTSSQEQQSHRTPLSGPPHNIPALSSSLSLLTSQNMGKTSPGPQDSALDPSGSFLALHPESTMNEPDLSSQHETSHRLDNVISRRPVQHGSSFSHEPSLLSSKTSLMRSAAEDIGSFHELLAAQVTANDSELSEHPILDFCAKTNESGGHFAELPVVHEKVNPATGHDPQRHEESTGYNSYSDTVTATAPGSSSQSQRSESKTRGSSSLFQSSLTIGSSASFLQSSAYTWDSARGIMEEPDLTLVSLNDSSVVCSESSAPLANASNQHDASTSQGAFQLLNAEVDVSGVPASDQSSATTSLSQQFAEIDLEFTSTPGNLQEAFLRKKKHLMEKSSKRVQEIKKKDRVTKTVVPKYQHKHKTVTQAEQPASSDTVDADRSHLKKVVEVRVCTPEDRKLTEIEMHQRTIRLYNQLDEVKAKKEQMTRQESYSKNREKAKEFKKRTLEKLRASKMK